ncbi:hypothetical protein Nepgr_030870 [Nepenthes gracilis]|uniref:Uncharacterized protein n=1 Tax=Nepenthes gracilis TaxID=150966 RepID=A0AAD3THT3_NEPGR|nr:hypothetical protein Nepgr_030870 [Nepenthes gracilis]
MQSLHINEDALEEAPASCSSLAAASLGLIAVVNEKDPSNTLFGCFQVDIDLEQHNEASGDQAAEIKPLKEAIQEANELLNSILSYVDCPGHALDLPLAIGHQEAQAQLVAGVLSCGDHHPEDIHKDRHHVSYAEVLRRGITVASAGILVAGAAHVPLRPITDADRLDALGNSNCSEEVVDSPALSSLAQVVLLHP